MGNVGDCTVRGASVVLMNRGVLDANDIGLLAWVVSPSELQLP